MFAAGSANAADLRAPVYKAPPPVAAPAPQFSWTGCFVGAHWGWGWGRKDVSETEVEREGGIVTSVSAASGRVDTSGPIFGGQVSCDYQFGVGKGFGPGAWVIGIQGDVAAADINGFDADPLGFGDGRNVIRVKQDWISSVTGRIGFVFPVQVLWYFKGGGAWTHDRWDLALTAENQEDGRIPSVIKQSRSGWTVGAGVEWAFQPNWSAFVEWDHYDFGTKNLFSNTECDDGCFFSESHFIDTKQRVETLKIGVNYRFNLFGVGKGKAPVVARY